jgi:hypothetical protein
MHRGEGIMNRHQNKRLRVSRRDMLIGTAFALGAVASGRVISQAAADDKLAQKDAEYQEKPKDAQRCDGCLSFQPPNACKFVQGVIKPHGWCQLFAPKT